MPAFDPHSLLYFIAGLLERPGVLTPPEPLMGLLRHATGKPPYHRGNPDEWRRFLQVDNPPMATTTVTTHACFMRVPEIQNALIALLGHQGLAAA